jgi:hypothetical protein
MEQERLNHLMARFLRLNDAGKAHITSLTRQLTGLCTPPEPVSRPSAAESAVSQREAFAGGPTADVCGMEGGDKEG